MGQLTLEQRYTIANMCACGHSQKSIAEHLGRDKSVISRELKRNINPCTGVYEGGLAQRKCQERHVQKPKRRYLTEALQEYIDSKLEQEYSPEQIVGEARLKNLPIVSHERIYQYIWSDKKGGGKLYKKLRNGGKRYRKRGALKDSRGIIQHRRDISERPPIVEQRSRFGDLEIDTIIGKGHKGAILTINDRATGMLKMVKLESKKAENLAEEATSLLQDWKHDLHTITSDNGKEFAAHQVIAKELSIDFFFAKPYHSWERGSNENLNGLIRQYIPKQTDLEQISQEEIKKIEDKLNNRPRKRLGFISPREAMKAKVAFIT